MTPRADPNRFTRVTLWITRTDHVRLIQAINDDLLPGLRVMHVVHDQALPDDPTREARR